MTATALLKFTQGLGSSTGWGLLINDTDPVLIENADNSGVGSFRISLAYAEPGYTAYTFNPGVIPAQVLSDGNGTPSATLIPQPGLHGCYRIVLEVWSGTGFTGTKDTDIRDLGVLTPNRLLLKPPMQKFPDPLPLIGEGKVGEKPNELNFFGQNYGWSGPQYDAGIYPLRLLNAALEYIDTLTATGTQTLSQTLGYGTHTGVHNIDVTHNDFINFESGTVGVPLGGVQANVDPFGYERIEFRASALDAYLEFSTPRTTSALGAEMYITGGSDADATGGGISLSGGSTRQGGSATSPGYVTLAGGNYCTDLSNPGSSAVHEGAYLVVVGGTALTPGWVDVYGILNPRPLPQPTTRSGMYSKLTSPGKYDLYWQDGAGVETRLSPIQASPQTLSQTLVLGSDTGGSVIRFSDTWTGPATGDIGRVFTSGAWDLVTGDAVYAGDRSTDNLTTSWLPLKIVGTASHPVGVHFQATSAMPYGTAKLRGAYLQLQDGLYSYNSSSGEAVLSAGSTSSPGGGGNPPVGSAEGGSIHFTGTLIWGGAPGYAGGVRLRSGSMYTDEHFTTLFQRGAELIAYPAGNNSAPGFNSSPFSYGYYGHSQYPQPFYSNPGGGSWVMKAGYNPGISSSYDAAEIGVYGGGLDVSTGRYKAGIAYIRAGSVSAGTADAGDVALQSGGQGCAGAGVNLILYGTTALGGEPYASLYNGWLELGYRGSYPTGYSALGGRLYSIDFSFRETGLTYYGGKQLAWQDSDGVNHQLSGRSDTEYATGTYAIAHPGMLEKFVRMTGAAICNVTLPIDTYLRDGAEWTLKDGDGLAYGRIVTAGAGTTVDGAASFTLPAARAAVTIRYYKAGLTWDIV